MKKEFINPELEVLRFQKGGDVLRCSEEDEAPTVSKDGYANSSRSLSRKFFVDDTFE